MTGSDFCVLNGIFNREPGDVGPGIAEAACIHATLDNATPRHMRVAEQPLRRRNVSQDNGDLYDEPGCGLSRRAGVP